MENVTSSRWLDLMERALIVRTVATPYNKADGLMLWGDTENKALEYQVGVFGGDGMNRPNIDNRFDGMARVVVRPLDVREDALLKLHIGAGASLRLVATQVRRSTTHRISSTPGGYTFWSSELRQGRRRNVVILPSGVSRRWSGEALRALRALGRRAARSST